MKVRVLDRAERQLDEIRDYIAEDRPRAAEKTMNRLRSTFDLIATRPGIGRPVPRETFRRWAVPSLPYIVTYEVDEAADEVVILAVFHGARKR